MILLLPLFGAMALAAPVPDHEHSDSTTNEPVPSPIKGVDTSAAIIILVILGSLLLLVPMFIYMYRKRRANRGVRLPGEGRKERDTWICEISRPERVLTLQRTGTGFSLKEKRGSRVKSDILPSDSLQLN
ncbi:hypothetical protein FPQ18DRAFT_307585 [Pyronema domesticum]|nr:hypothetical protein FPQ18DRAFT_307585 [Pyronema domesticum]